jgi:hypothetical protein
MIGTGNSEGDSLAHRGGCYITGELNFTGFFQAGAKRYEGSCEVEEKGFCFHNGGVDEF